MIDSSSIRVHLGLGIALANVAAQTAPSRLQAQRTERPRPAMSWATSLRLTLTKGGLYRY
jgi:hypothetical protein